jgi:hypothetical protein
MSIMKQYRSQDLILKLVFKSNLKIITKSHGKGVITGAQSFSNDTLAALQDTPQE